MKFSIFSIKNIPVAMTKIIYSKLGKGEANGVYTYFSY